MLDQLWYTSSPVGLSGFSGFQVRAASAGLKDRHSQRYAALAPYLHYQLPLSDSPYTAVPEDTPVSFALLNLVSERALVRKKYVGRDHTGRPGNYFAHAVVGLSPSFTARDATSAWTARLWVAESLPESETSLPSVDESELCTAAVPGEVLDDMELANLLAPFIEAFLSIAEHKRLFVVARPERVARLVYELTACLPDTLTRDLSFNTYERDVDQSPARIVGTWWKEEAAVGAGRDPWQVLQARAAASGGVALDLRTPPFRVGREGAAARYANIVQQALCLGNRLRLTAIVRAAQDLGIRNVDWLIAQNELLMRPAQMEAWSRSDMETVLGSPAMASQWLAVAAHRRLLLDFFTERSDWAGRGGELLARLRLQGGKTSDANLLDSLTNLADEAQAAARLAIEEDRPDEASCLVEKVAAPAGGVALETLWATVGPQTVSWETLDNQLALAMPEEYRVDLVATVLCHFDPEEDGDNVRRLADAHASLLKQALAVMSRHKARHETALGVLKALEGHPEQAPIAEEMLVAGLEDDGLMNGILDLWQPSPEAARRVLETMVVGQSVGALGSGAGRLVEEYLKSLSIPECMNPQTLQLLDRLTHVPTQKALVLRRDLLPLARAWYSLAKLLAGSDIPFGELQRLGGTLRDLPTDRQLAVAVQVAQALASRIGSQRNLINALAQLKDLAGNGLEHIVFDIMIKALCEADPPADTADMLPYFELACDMTYRIKLRDAAVHLRPLVNGPRQRKILADIDQAAQRWPPASGKRWHDIRRELTADKTKVLERLEWLLTAVIVVIALILIIISWPHIITAFR